MPSGTMKEHVQEYREYYNNYFGENTNCLTKATIFADVVYSYFRFGAWTNNYFEYQFWKKSTRKRDEFLTWKRARKFINDVNGTAHSPIFRQKHQFLGEFKDYINRDWLYVPDATYEEMVKFFNGHSYLMQKNDQGMFGIGVSKICGKDIDDMEAYYDYATKNDILLEEYIEECNELKCLHSTSLNTIRVMTLCDKSTNKVAILGAVLRMGNGGAVVDNARSNGLFAKIDVETGIVKTKAVDFDGDAYIVHPYSGQQVLGITIPEWKNVKQVCKKAALKHKEVSLVGWDVVVREDNGKKYVELIEGNDRPGVPTLQVPEQKGIYYKVQKCMKNWRK